MPRFYFVMITLVLSGGIQGAQPTWSEKVRDGNALLAFLKEREAAPQRDHPPGPPAVVDTAALNQKAAEWTPHSKLSWPRNIKSTRALNKITASTIKGIGGIDRPEHLDDLVELGIGHATVNVHLNHLLFSDKRPGTMPHDFEGTRYHVNQGWLGKLDRTIGFLSRKKIVVSVIILITPPKGGQRHEMIHPEADPAGTLAMPNLATAAGTKCYAAALDFLAERYTREDVEFGRISNWIAHNEVDYAWTWTNMGEQPMPRLLECYYRSMRLIHCSARKYDPHARVFASFTHHWFHPGDGKRTYRTRGMLSLLNRLSKAEGDFDWGIAYHPYPENLLQQRTWEDRQPTFSFQSPKITMKNIEVLDAFLKQPEFLYRGKRRPLILSEQGYHTPSYSESHQHDQAAALVYTWHKLKELPSIEAFHYHRWVDNPHEGGLRLGLRTLPSRDHPIGRKKKAWSVYQALGTPEEAGSSAFALKILGLKSFDDIPHRGPVPAP